MNDLTNPNEPALPTPPPGTRWAPYRSLGPDQAVIEIVEDKGDSVVPGRRGNTDEFKRFEGGFDMRAWHVRWEDGEVSVYRPLMRRGEGTPVDGGHPFAVVRDVALVPAE